MASGYILNHNMNRTILVTGATSGIGKSAAIKFASQGHNLILACRNPEKMNQLIDSFEKKERQLISGVTLDLSSFESIRNCVEILNREQSHLDVLVNNAGLFNLKYRESIDGIEETFAVNHLGMFLLSNLLIPLLKKGHNSRIVNVGSNSHFFASLKLEDLFFKKRKYTGFKAYGASRLATVLFTQELSNQLLDSGITVNCGHPGHVATNIWKFDNPGLMDRIVGRIQESTASTPEEGARIITYLATSPEVEGVSGKYFAEDKEKIPSKKANDFNLQQMLWKKSLELTGL